MKRYTIELSDGYTVREEGNAEFKVFKQTEELVLLEKLAYTLFGLKVRVERK